MLGAALAEPSGSPAARVAPSIHPPVKARYFAAISRNGSDTYPQAVHMKRWRRPQNDRVTPEIWNAVMARDGGCVAPLLDKRADPCAGPATVDHVKDAARLGKRGASDAFHLVAMCHHHNVDGWASAHRGLERWYLQQYRRHVEAEE